MRSLGEYHSRAAIGISSSCWWWLAVGLLGCQEPTQVRLHVRTDVPHVLGRTLSITAAPPDRVEGADPDAVVDQPWGGTGEVGTIVVVPEEDHNGKLGVRVVMGVTRDPSDCTGLVVEGCIIARRRLSFLEHRTVELPVGLHAACEGVRCDENSTCNALGQCVSAEVDPSLCESPDDPQCMPEGDVLPGLVLDGGAADANDGAADSSLEDAAACSTCGALEECWNGELCVAQSVAVTGGYSIDATEVTRSQYEAWLATSPDPSAGQPPYCTWNASYTPQCEWPPATKGSHPVVCVNWCDAYAYCQAVGKRLCGRIGGGAIGYGDIANAALSQWYNACSSNGANAYPYGDTYDGQTCNGGNSGLLTTASVGTLDGCQSSVAGYTGVYDQSGNAWEWEDACDAVVGAQDGCRLRGGAHDYDASGLRCDVDNYLMSTYFVRGDVHPTVGFRCCSP